MFCLYTPSKLSWIFTEGEGDGIRSRLPFKMFSTLKTTFDLRPRLPNLCIPTWMFSRFNCRDEYYDKTYRLSKHNGVEVFIKSGLNFHPPAISQYIFQIFNINEKLNNMSWNRGNIENQTRLHKFFDPIMVNLPLTYRILTYHPKKKYRYILKSGLNFLSTCSFTIYFSDFQSLMKRKTK